MKKSHIFNKKKHKIISIYLFHFCSMFNRLQTRWKVSAGRLFLIIATFAIGGSLCGYTGRKLLSFTNIEEEILWVIAYLTVISVLWPIAVLIVSIPLGQFSFFKRYLHNMLEKIRGTRKTKDKNPNSF